MKLLWFLAFAAALHICAGMRVLVLVPMPAKSHHNLFERLSIELTKRGHHVTLISAFPQPKPVPNLREIVLPNLHSFLISLMGHGGKPGGEPNMFEMRNNNNPILAMLFMPKMGFALCDKILEEPIIKDLINSDEKYDLILGEAFLDESLLAGFSHKFKAPLIAVATFMPNHWTNYMVGNPAPASYIPDPLLGYSSRMTFTERLTNTVVTVLGELSHELWYLPQQDKIMRKHFGMDYPPLQEIITNTSLVLVNHHHSLAFPRPYLPNMVEIGGYHVNPPRPLPEDLKKFMDEAKDGVILFSMGSNLKSAHLSPELRQSILKAFSKLKQNVLWKFEDDSMKNLPNNVKISKWLPQSDILAHPHMKLFITHGGLLSTTEAAIRGVPVVGIPIFGDQPLNMRITANAGLGVYLDFDDLNDETLYAAVTEVLNNPKYNENAKLRSRVLQDTPLSAMDTALYWIEYVVRHKGAPHLRSAAQDLAWYQLYLLDVIAVLALGIGVVAAVNIYVVKLVCRCLCSKKCKKTDKTTPQKKKN